MKKTRYLRSGDSYFAARKGEKAVVVTLRIRNTGGLRQLQIDREGAGSNSYTNRRSSVCFINVMLSRVRVCRLLVL